MRDFFPALEKSDLHYLDNAATTQIVRPALDALFAFEGGVRGNAHRGVHRAAEAASGMLECSRRQVARFMSTSPDQIIFTPGTTLGLNFLALAVSPLLSPGANIVATQSEHHSNLLPWRAIAAQRGLEFRTIPLHADGTLAMESLDRVIDERTAVVTVTHRSNVTGAWTDMGTIATATHDIGAILVVDGAQAIGDIDASPAELGADAYVFSGHKVFGPTGVGVLWLDPGLAQRCLRAFSGGGMVRRVTERHVDWLPGPAGFEAGTVPLGAIVGLGAALAWLGDLDRRTRGTELGALATRLRSGLETFPGTRVLGHRTSPIVSFDIAGIHPHDLAHFLDLHHDVAVRAGNFCAQPFFAALGWDWATRASLTLYNTPADVDALLIGIEDACKTLR